jgi:hypothetical protein
MRSWASQQLGVDKLSSTNIPAIERLMNSYECFKDYMENHEQKKDYRLLYQALAEPGFTTKRGLLLIILEVSIEEVTIKKGEKTEFKKEIKFERVRNPPYPITEEQKQSNVAFLVHYTKITREKYSEKKVYKNYGWEPLMYVEGVTTATGSRHKPKMFFQQSERPWPPVIEKRYQEFLDNCSNKRGPFTSQFGFDPYALIGASGLIKGISVAQPNAIIRDSYNHMVGVAYKVDDSSEMISIPVSDDGSMHLNRNTFFDWDDFKPAAADVIVDFYRKVVMEKFGPFSAAYAPRRLRTQDDVVVGVELRNKFVIPAKPASGTPPEGLDKPEPIEMWEWDNNKTIAYDSKTRADAFEHAGVKDPMEGKYITLESSSIQDEIEDVYQHLRLSFASWLARPSAGKEIREKLEEILKRNDLPLFEKRKRLDILLEAKITGWLEPKGEGDKTELGFLRVDCITQPQSGCTGRCKWISGSSSASSQEQNKCSIHTPASISPNGSLINVPRMLYLRLVDELIRYASRREEIFMRKVPRLTIRQEAQLIGDQFIIPEGSADWNTWWEKLRAEWIATEAESPKTFEDQFEPIPNI